jgi:hypothetical protein
MSTDAGAVAPYQGKVVEPAQVTSPEANLTHQFCNVVRHLITHSGAYRNEADETRHLDVVNRYEQSSVGGALRHLLSEDDHAPREDVSQRVPAPGQNVQAVPVAAAPQIDYGRLAAAILAAQKQDQEGQYQEGKD